MKEPTGHVLCSLLLSVLVFIALVPIMPQFVVHRRIDPGSNSEECTLVIVTGTAAENGRAILMKNRDTGDSMNVPDYYAAAGGLFACVMVNGGWMGINERGLAVVNTALVALAFGGGGLDNGLLNRWIAQHCETVDQVCYELNNTAGEIGPGKRLGGTCIGVVDRFGEGAFIEVSGVGAYTRFVVNGYDSEANHPRYYPGYASGPSGRDQYALDIMNSIHAEEGTISYEDVVQNVSRYVHDKEQGSANFSISGEISNTMTQSSMVAVSGDQRYDGKLNCMWGEYGNPPMVGLFIPSMVFAGAPPAILDGFWNKVWQKRSEAQDTKGYYNPAQVRQIQSYTFFIEDYAFSKYDELVATIPDNLSSNQLRTALQEYVNSTVQQETRTYIAEPQLTYYSVTKGTRQYRIPIVSNSAIINFQSSIDTQAEIKFNTTGPSNSTGFAYVGIPRDLCSENLTLTIGSSQCPIEDVTGHEGYIIVNLVYSQPNFISFTGTCVSVSDINESVLNAATNDAYFIQTGNTYDAHGMSYVYSACTNPQNMRMMNDPETVVQTNPNQGKPTVSNMSIVLFGGPLAHNCTEYYERTGQTPILFSATVYGPNLWGFTKCDGTTIPNASINMSQVNGHSDIFTVEAFTDSSNNFVIIAYGMTQVGTLAAGPYFKESVLPNLINYTECWYIFRWTDGTNGQPFDGFPQPNEISLIAKES